MSRDDQMSVPHADAAWRFYRDTLNCPTNFSAPMVDQSELPYRMLVRRYNVHVAYTPMFHSRLMCEQETYRKRVLQDLRACPRSCRRVATVESPTRAPTPHESFALLHMLNQFSIQMIHRGGLQCFQQRQPRRRMPGSFRGSPAGRKSPKEDCTPGSPAFASTPGGE